MKYNAKQASALVDALLKDEWGVSEEAYEHLHVLIEAFGLKDEYAHKVDATDGRFYIVGDLESNANQVYSQAF